MNTDLDRLRAVLRETLRKSGVRRAAVFGSAARGQATEASDVDLLIEFEPGKSLLDLAALKLTVEELLRRPVDIVTYGSLHPLLRDHILNEQVPIF